MKGVITGDWHLRKAPPVSRPETEEEWLDFIFGMVDTVIAFCMKNDLDLFNTGDIFDNSQPWYGIVGRLKAALADFDRFYKLAGNHDEPYHSYSNILNSGWFNCLGIDMTERFKGAFHFGTEPKNPNAKIIFTHQLVFPSKKDMPPHSGGKTAAELLEEFPKAKWIFTGDYHKHFHYEEDGRHVVNPGTLCRQKASEEDYETGFYEVDTSKGLVKFHVLEDDVEMVLDHLEKAKEREDRLDAFIEKIEKQKGKLSKDQLSFKENLKAKSHKKGVKKGVLEILSEIETEVGRGVKK